MSEREHIRRWCKRVYTRIQFTIWLILLARMWLTWLPALWESNISRGVAMDFTVLFIGVEVWTLRALWRWLSPYWRLAPEQEGTTDHDA